MKQPKIITSEIFIETDKSSVTLKDIIKMTLSQWPLTLRKYPSQSH